MTFENPWRTIPRKIVIVFLLAVFFTFTTLGFANDIMDFGHEPPLRFGISVVLTGVFAVCYAVSSLYLRSKFWKAMIPVFALQFVVMGILGHYLPDLPHTSEMNAAETGRVQNRLVFDGIATVLSVSLGYGGFVWVFVSESKRHIRVHTEKAFLEAEMAAAREIQQVIVPEKGEIFSGFKVESVYQPARQVGGDFFQVLPAGGDGLLVVVGDVAGKGLPAAMLVSMIIGFIRATAEDSHDPVWMLRKLHDRLLGRTVGGFATALAAHIARDGVITIANAGHLSPYLDGKELELPGALPLGIAESGQFDATRLELWPGSRLTFYSDGVVEAQNKTGELFGFERAKTISTQSAAAIAAAAVEFGQEDDITVVTIERLATGENGAILRDIATMTRPLRGKV